MSSAPKRLPSWRDAIVHLRRAGIPLLSQGRELMRWGKLNLTWLFDHPPESLSENDASLALLITPIAQPRIRALLSGDLEKNGEERLRSVWMNSSLHKSPLTFWHVNHHGSSTSTSAETVELLDPKVAILSLDGEHRFGFPHPLTIRTLRERGVQVKRLDIEGDITYHLASSSTW